MQGTQCPYPTGSLIQSPMVWPTLPRELWVAPGDSHDNNSVIINAQGEVKVHLVNSFKRSLFSLFSNWVGISKRILIQTVH